MLFRSFKVTAVQVMPVMQPSQWQQSYSRFNALQEELLSKRIGDPAEAAVAK